MSLHLNCNIIIGNRSFDRTSGVEITSSWKSLGDTANLKMVGWVQDVELGGRLVGPIRKLEDLVTVGDRVEIQLGYNGELRTEFRGYVAEVKLTVPFEVRCEDEYFWLKRSPVNRSWKHTTLHKLLHDLAGLVKPAGTRLVLGPGMEKRNFSIEGFVADPGATVARALDKIKQNYLVCAYFRDGKLFVGLPYTEFTSSSQVPGALAKYGFQQNVVSDDLSYQRKEDVHVKAKVVAIHPNGKHIHYEAGDVDGEERTITLRLGTKDHPDTYDQTRLHSMAETELAKYKYEGYRGSLTGFGVPYVVHSGVAELHDDYYPQRAGRYLVNSVTTSFGPDGFRRKVELGARVSV